MPYPILFFNKIGFDYLSRNLFTFFFINKNGHKQKRQKGKETLNKMEEQYIAFLNGSSKEDLNGAILRDGSNESNYIYYALTLDENMKNLYNVQYYNGVAIEAELLTDEIKNAEYKTSVHELNMVDVGMNDVKIVPVNCINHNLPIHKKTIAKKPPKKRAPKAPGAANKKKAATAPNTKKKQNKKRIGSGIDLENDDDEKRDYSDDEDDESYNDDDDDDDKSESSSSSSSTEDNEDVVEESEKKKLKIEIPDDGEKEWDDGPLAPKATITGIDPSEQQTTPPPPPPFDWRTAVFEIKDDEKMAELPITQPPELIRQEAILVEEDLAL